MNGHASFNEVFLIDARIPAANLVGELDDGSTQRTRTEDRGTQKASPGGRTSSNGDQGLP
jgi:hypothetical protein